MKPSYSREDVKAMITSTDLPGLLQALQYGDKFVASDAVDALVDVGGELAFEPLIETLNNRVKHKLVRVAAAIGLGKLGNKKAVPHLIQALKNNDLLLPAIKALERLGDKSAIKPLIEAMTSGVRLTQRHAIEDTLGAFGEPAIKPLSKVLHHRNSDVREGVVCALHKTSDRKAVDLLIRALKDPDANVRWLATRALGDILDERAVKPLLKMLNNEKDSYVREEAEQTLGKLGSK